MDSTINSSRVQVQMGIIPTELGLAPDIIDLDSEIVSPETYDEVALNLSGRATFDPDDDRSQTPQQITSYAVKTNMFSELSMSGH